MLSNLTKHTHSRTFIGADLDNSALVVIFGNDPAPGTANAAYAFSFPNYFVQFFSLPSPKRSISNSKIQSDGHYIFVR
jgi:hypothetical protein